MLIEDRAAILKGNDSDREKRLNSPEIVVSDCIHLPQTSSSGLAARPRITEMPDWTAACCIRVSNRHRHTLKAIPDAK